MRYIIFVFLFLNIALSIIARDMPRFRNGHAHDITYLTQKDDLFFSADKAGMVKAWAEDGNLLAELQISHYPIHYIDFSKKNDLLVILSGTGGNHTYLSVWAWTLREELYTKTLEEPPLALSLSPEGRFIVYSVFEMDSIRILLALSGRETQLMRGTASLVSNFLINSTEQRMMTYSSTQGLLNYFTINNGNLIQSINTIKNLQNLKVLPDRRHALGKQNNSLLSIDLLSGRLIDSIDLQQEKIIDHYLNENQLFLILHSTEEGRRHSLRTYTMQSGTFKDEKNYPLKLQKLEHIGVLTQEDIILSDGQSTLYQMNLAQQEIKPFVTNNTVAITSYLLQNDQFIIASEDHILRFTLNQSIQNMLTQGNPATLSFSSTQRQPRDPFNALYDNNDAIPFNQLPHDIRNSIFEQDMNLTSQIRHSQFSNNTVLFLANTSLYLYDLEEKRLITHYTSIGIEDAYYLPSKGIFMGLSAQTNSFALPLLRLNPQTGETVPMESSLFLIFDIDYDLQVNTLWTLGLKNTPSGVRTVLEGRTGNNFEYYWTEEYILGEELDTKIAINDQNNTVMLLSTENRKRQKESTLVTNMPEGSYLSAEQVVDSHLIGISKEGNLELWHIPSGKKILQLYILENGEWLATGKNYYITSQEISPEKYFNTFSGDITQFRHSQLRVQRTLPNER